MGAIPIKVGTLNYSGINYSPFEFYSTDEKETKIIDQMGNIFHELIKKEFKLESNIDLKNKFDWKIGSIDKYTQRERYSPIYRKNVGLTRDGLMSRKQFQERWESEYQKNVRPLLETKKQIVMYDEKVRCQQLDYLLYKTFVEYIYSQRAEKTGEKFIPTLDDRETDRNICQRYEELMSQFFQKDYLNDDRKIVTMITNLFKNDIVFFQDLSATANQTLVKNTSSMFDLTYHQTSSCAILIKKQTFDQILSFEQGLKKYKLQNIEEIKPHNFDYYRKQPPLILFAQKKGYFFLLASIHLSSGSMKDQQIEDFMNHMVQLRRTFKKQGKSIEIIIGGDFNQFIGKFAAKHQDFSHKFKFYPNKEEGNFTTMKKRTCLHAQMKKTWQQDKKCRDFIVTHLPITQGGIHNSRGGKIGRDTWLPCQEHPFDHYMVHATLQFGGLF